MNKFFVYLSLLIGFSLQGQYKVTDSTELEKLRRVPMEKIYIHLSSSTIMPGEYLYYKLYCINAANHKLSNISTLAYVDIFDGEGRRIVNQKINLESGMGQGDIFFNTRLPTGKYTLVAYTNWMQNSGADQVYRETLTLVNPYTTENIGQHASGLKGPLSYASSASSNAPLHIQLDSSTYNTRDRITVRLRNYQGARGFGNYSLVVRKMDDLSASSPLSSEEFSLKYKEVDQFPHLKTGDSVSLPEQRGELFYGKVLEKGKDTPVAGEEVFISIPGENYILKSAVTNDEGYFYTYIRKPYQDTLVYFQVASKKAVTIHPARPKSFQLEPVGVRPYNPDPQKEHSILQRSIYNQIENAFIGMRPDSVQVLQFVDPFDGGSSVTFRLDDYTRFPTFQETLIEILNYVGYRNSPEGDYIRVLQDFEEATEEYNNDPAIVLIDGLLIPDHELIKDFNSKKIELIKVVRDPLVFGNKDYQGIVFIKTFDGDYPLHQTHHNSASLSIKIPQPRKHYYKQSYSGNKSLAYARIPDYRQILLWEPSIVIDQPELEVHTYTSDLEGNFEVVLEGFTHYGKPISLRKEFTVEN